MINGYINLSCLALVGVSAVSQWGWLNGLGVVAFTYLVMPYKPR